MSLPKTSWLTILLASLLGLDLSRALSLGILITINDGGADHRETSPLRVASLHGGARLCAIKKVAILSSFVAARRGDISLLSVISSTMVSYRAQNGLTASDANG